MQMNARSGGRLMAGIVLAHLAVTLAHGLAHSRAGVAITPAQALFVWIVILAGPVVGLGLLLFGRPDAGAWTIGATLTGSLVFGLVNHFVLDSPDHVRHVVGPYRPLFTTTAALLMLLEGAGAAAASKRIVQSARADTRAATNGSTDA
jgi:hypothetical protein